MLGYWSVSQRNILGMPSRAVVEVGVVGWVDTGKEGELGGGEDLDEDI